DRVFEISAEPLLAADPDVLLVLYQGEGDGSDLVAEMIAQDQLSSLRAVQQDALLPLLFNFAEPASPLVVDGLERIHEWLLDLEGGAGRRCSRHAGSATPSARTPCWMGWTCTWPRERCWAWWAPTAAARPPRCGSCIAPWCPMRAGCISRA